MEQLGIKLEAQRFNLVNQPKQRAPWNRSFFDPLSTFDYLWDDLGSAAQLVESAEDGLMRSIIDREIHVLRPLCPPVNIRKYDLRPSPHNFLLPLRDDTKYIPRTLLRWLRPNP